MKGRRHNPQNMDSAKGLNGTLKRLFKEMSHYKKIILIALILALFSSVIAIITPKRLSLLTDEISKGLMVDEVKIKEITETIISNNMSKDIKIDDVDITILDQQVFLKTMNELKEVKSRDTMYKKIKELPTSIQNLLEPKMNKDVILKFSIILGILYLVSNLFGYIQTIITMNTGNKFARELRSKIASKINRLPLNYYDKNATGDILSRVTNDVDNISGAISQSSTTLISSVVMILGAVVMMVYTNFILALAAIFSSIFGFIFMMVVMKKSQKYFIEKQEELGNLNGHIEEIYSSLNVVKVYNGREDAIKKFTKYNNKLRNSNEKSTFLSGLMMPMMMFIGNFGFVVVCIVGALLALEGHITFGVIIAFIMYVRLFTNPLSQIAQGLTYLQSVAASSERVFQFLDENEMSEENNITKYLDKLDVSGTVEFKNVAFKYPDNKKMTIKDFSAKTKPGEKIAIVGPTGAGKTTMVNLLMKFYDITKGDILIDGISINDLSRENIRNLFTMVLQDTWLFEGTVKDNIIYNRKDITDDKLQNICASIGLDHFIKTLPNGYDSIILENDSISSGQKQLITIARAMLEDSPLLILDEATSNVDTRTEELVQKAMDKLTEGKTSFIIAHRLSTIKNADLILVMKDGNIIEQGNHNKLMKEKGFYFELYNSQFEL